MSNRIIHDSAARQKGSRLKRIQTKEKYHIYMRLFIGCKEMKCAKK